MKPTLGELIRSSRQSREPAAARGVKNVRLDAALKARAEVERALDKSKGGREARYLKDGVNAIADALLALTSAEPPPGAPGTVMVRVVGGGERRGAGAVPLPQVRVRLQAEQLQVERTTDAFGFVEFRVPEGADGRAYEVVALGPDDKPWARAGAKASRKPQTHVLLASGGSAMTGNAALGRKVAEALAQAAEEIRAIHPLVTKDVDEERKELNQALDRLDASIEVLCRKEHD